MSYTVFARKWRPLTFDDVVGQEHITGTLKKAIQKDRVAHAYIFSGTRGVGKTTTARILARALNCENGPTPTPCGTCTTCTNISSGSSFDVLEIDGASNNSVDDIRELRETIGYSSMGGKYRIFVIDEVHMLSKSAFNALLKTLEEPPKNVIFIFATTEPQKIPATILSRCQRYDFRRISSEQIMERLVHICEAEKIGFERSALMLVARKADGSMRDALSLLDQVFSFSQDSLREQEVRSVLGLVGMEIYNTVMDAVESKDPSPALKAIQDVLYHGFDLHEFIQGLQEHLRNLLFARIPNALQARGIEIEADTAQHYIKSAARFPEGDLLRMSEMVRKAEQDLKWSAYPRFLAELLLLKLVYLDNTLAVETLLKTLGTSAAENADSTDPTSLPSELKKKTEIILPPQIILSPDSQTQKRNSPAVPKISINQVAEDGVIQPFAGSVVQPEKGSVGSFESDGTAGAVSDLRGAWPSFLEFLMRDRPNLGSFLSHGHIAGGSGLTVDLRFAHAYRFQFSEVTKKHNRDEINTKLREFAGSATELNITLEKEKSESEGQNYIKQVGDIKSTINDEIENEPIIQSILEIFDGEVID